MTSLSLSPSLSLSLSTIGHRSAAIIRTELKIVSFAGQPNLVYPYVGVHSYIPSGKPSK